MAARPRDTLEFSMGTVPNSAPGGAGNINDMMICPYDESHVVSGGKFHKHIYRCRQVLRFKLLTHARISFYF